MLNKNEIVIDGKVQKDAKVMSEMTSFNICAITGEYQLVDNTKRNRYTYIRVLYPTDETPDLKKILMPREMVRVYGKLDSEQYVSKSDKIVYNKVLTATKVVPLRYNKELGEYEEVN